MKKIIIAVDFSIFTPFLISSSLSLLDREDNEIILLHVTRPKLELGASYTDVSEPRHNVAAQYVEERKQLQALVEEIRKDKVKVRCLMLSGGPIENVIAQESQKVKADLIVIGTHGKGAITGKLLGSVSQGLLKLSKTPLLIVPKQTK